MYYAVRRTLAFASASLVACILLVSITYGVKSFWTYFTNWSLFLQFTTYVSVLDDCSSRQILVDVGILAAWTVALSYSIVVAISPETLENLYAAYGVAPFWIGNSALHYIPPILLSASVVPLRASPKKRALATITLVSLIVIYNASHNTKDVYDTDVLTRVQGTLCMAAGACILVFVVFDFRRCIKALVPPGLQIEAEKDQNHAPR